MSLQDAIDTVMDGNELREMTRHNAAKFALATVKLVGAARQITDPDLEAMRYVLVQFGHTFPVGGRTPDYSKWVQRLFNAALGVSDDRE